MKSIFVTGAANGIGRAVAQHFLDQGWKVGAYDIAPVAYEHENLRTGTLDVTDPEQWVEALEDFQNFAGTINVIDNNAGIIIDGGFNLAEPAAIKKIIDVNCLGVSYGARYAADYLANGGTLVNMCSAAAIYGQPGIAAYSATKFYVKGLTEALNLEWQQRGIRVVDICPLWAKTSLADVEAVTVRRLGVRITPEQVAATVWQAVHPKNRFERTKVHYGVSTLDKALAFARELAPFPVAKALTALVAK